MFWLSHFYFVESKTRSNSDAAYAVNGSVCCGIWHILFYLKLWGVSDFSYTIYFFTLVETLRPSVTQGACFVDFLLILMSGNA